MSAAAFIHRRKLAAEQAAEKNEPESKPQEKPSEAPSAVLGDDQSPEHQVEAPEQAGEAEQQRYSAKSSLKALRSAAADLSGEKYQKISKKKAISILKDAGLYD